MLSPLSLPITQLSVLALGLFVVLYLAIAPFYQTDKQRAYIMSTFSSFCMTLSSLPFLYRYARGGFDEVLSVKNGWAGNEGAKVMVVFFGCYLSADLGVGVVMYPKQIGVLTGWIHHTVYIALMYHLAINSNLCSVFLVACIMELPTFHLAISHLIPSLRHDAVFLGLMFATRICFHAYLLLDCAFASTALEGSYLPISILIPSAILHAGWFSNGVKGYLRRRRSGRDLQPDASAARATALEPELLEGTLPSLMDDSMSSSSSSPSESPLVTPRTTTPSTLFPSLALQLPIPAKLQLPPLAFPDHRAFSNAVKQSWEDNKDRFRQGIEGVRNRRNFTQG